MLARLHIVNYGVQKSIKRTAIGESEQQTERPLQAGKVAGSSCVTDLKLGEFTRYSWTKVAYRCSTPRERPREDKSCSKSSEVWTPECCSHAWGQGTWTLTQQFVVRKTYLVNNKISWGWCLPAKLLAPGNSREMNRGAEAVLSAVVTHLLLRWTDWLTVNPSLYTGHGRESPDLGLLFTDSFLAKALLGGQRYVLGCY